MAHFPFHCLWLVVIVSLWFSLNSPANAHRAHRAHNGIATFYTSYIPSSCYGDKEEGVMIAAASDAFYHGGKACGKKYRVKCLGGVNRDSPNPCFGGSVVVKIVDYCPRGCRGTIDLSEQAFASIANPDAGVIRVSFKEL